MNTIVKNEIDSFGKEAFVGDLIIYAIHSELRIGIILKFTPCSIVISTSSFWKRSYNWKEHDIKKYRRKNWFSFKVLEENVEIPQILLPYCNFNQIRIPS